MIKRLGLILTLLSMCLPGAVASAGTGNDKSVLESAHALALAGNNGQALEIVEGYLARTPGDPQARFLKGVLLTNMEQLAAAEEIFQQLVHDYPDLPEPYNNLAVIYASQGEYDKSRAALQSAIKTHPTYATAHENLGDIYTMLANRAYRQALELDNENSSAKAKLSMVNQLASLSSGIVVADNRGAGQPESSPPDSSRKPVVPVTRPAKLPAVEPIRKPEPVIAVVVDAAADKPVPAVSPRQLATQQIGDAVHDWAAAWSGKDVDRYLAHYASNFKVPNNWSRERWMKVRRARLNKPRFIKVDVRDLQVELIDADTAIATFRQDYRADHYSDSVVKTLDLTREGGRWLIRDEYSGG